MNTQNRKSLLLKDIDQLLGEQIGYESSKDLEAPWTKEYREGYVDGLKQALDCLKNLTDDGYFLVSSIHRQDLKYSGYTLDSIDDRAMASIASKMCEAYCKKSFWSITYPITPKKWAYPRYAFEVESHHFEFNMPHFGEVFF